MENMAWRFQEGEGASMLVELRFDAACGGVAVDVSAELASGGGAHSGEDDPEPRSLDQEPAPGSACGAETVHEDDSRAPAGWSGGSDNSHNLGVELSPASRTTSQLPVWRGMVRSASGMIWRSLRMILRRSAVFETPGRRVRLMLGDY